MSQIVMILITIKHVSNEYKCKFDGKNYNSNQIWNKKNVDPSAKIKKDLIGKR